MKTLKEELEAIYATEKVLESRKIEIYKASLEAPADLKVCNDGMAQEIVEVLSDNRHIIQYPIQVMGIDTENFTSASPDACTGKWAAIRPCADEHENKTFLGIFLGALPFGVSCTYNQQSGVLTLFPGVPNPAIFVPELKKIIFGAESWWRILESPSDLKQITNQDINDTWYVQAIKYVGNSTPQE